MRLYFRDGGHFFAKFLFNILIIYPKCHFFQFFSRDIRMHIPILRSIQKKLESHQKGSVFFFETMFFCKLLFSDENHLYANCFFYILNIYPKCLLFQFLSGGIRIHIPILTGIENGRTCLQKKQSYFAKKRCFWGFMSEMEATWIPLSWIFFLLLLVNAFYFSFL